MHYKIAAGRKSQMTTDMQLWGFEPWEPSPNSLLVSIYIPPSVQLCVALSI
jgi:hypothetical protein